MLLGATFLSTCPLYKKGFARNWIFYVIATFAIKNNLTPFNNSQMELPINLFSYQWLFLFFSFLFYIFYITGFKKKKKNSFSLCCHQERNLLLLYIYLGSVVTCTLCVNNYSSTCNLECQRVQMCDIDSSLLPLNWFCFYITRHK